MKPSMRLLSELGAAASSWARPITLKEALTVTSSIGSAFVVANQWAISVQLSAHAQVSASAMKAELACVKADMTVMKAELTGVKADIAEMKAETTGIKAKLDDILLRLPMSPKR